MCGGHTQAKPADEQSRQILEQVKDQVFAQMNATYETFEVVEYTTQVVAGTNYTITVNVGDDKRIKVKVFKPLPCNGTELSVSECSEL